MPSPTFCYRLLAVRRQVRDSGSRIQVAADLRAAGRRSRQGSGRGKTTPFGTPVRLKIFFGRTNRPEVGCYLLLKLRRTAFARHKVVVFLPSPWGEGAAKTPIAVPQCIYRLSCYRLSFPLCHLVAPVLSAL